MKKSCLLFLLIPMLLVGCDGGTKETLQIVSNLAITTYNCGNNFDPTGLIVEYTNSKGEKSVVTDYEIVGGKNLTVNDSQIKIKYGSVSVKLPITVNPVFEGGITCVGDSLTEGHNWPNQAYPTYIKSNFTDSSLMTIKNCGKNGASFKTFGQYNPAYNTTTQYTDSLTGNPRVLTILLGTNDATNWANEQNDFVNDYTNLVETYKETFGDDLNIIMITSPRCTSNSFGIPNETINNEVVPLQRQLAEDLDLPLIDLNEEFAKSTYKDSDLFRDGVHFTEKAAKVTAELISTTIKEIYGI